MWNYSSRLPDDLSPTLLAARVKCGGDLIDLSCGNPTQCGLSIDTDLLARAFSHKDLARYEPDARGLLPAREVICQFMRGRGVVVSPERLFLTASTSESYSILFKLLANPGDFIAEPSPSYPLVQHLAELEGVGSRRYRLYYDGRWRIDFASLERALRQGVKAVVVVQPNNPTGAALDAGERLELRELCSRYRAALIADEVFAWYGSETNEVPSLGDESSPLTFVLDGFSKSLGLPQLKLGWIALSGVEAEPCVPRLEWILDSYLSVSTAAQLAALSLAPQAALFADPIRARIKQNRDFLRAVLSSHPRLELLRSQGGWSAVLSFNFPIDEEKVAAALLDAGVIVQPGYFFDFHDSGYCVLSLLVEPPLFKAGVERLLSYERQL